MIPIDRYIKTAQQLLKKNPGMSVQTLASQLKRTVKRPTARLSKMDVGFDFYIKIATMISRQVRQEDERLNKLRDKLMESNL